MNKDNLPTIDQELLAVFRQEVTEALDELAQLVELLRTGPDEVIQASVAAAFRIAHNVKGAARATGVEPVELLTHAMEDALAIFRSSSTRPPEDLLACLLEATVLIEQVVEGKDVFVDIQTLVGRLEQIVASTPPADTTAAPGANGAKGNTSDAKGTASTPRPSTGSASRATATTVRVEVDRLDRLMAQTGELLAMQSRVGQRVERGARLAQVLREAAKRLPVGERAVFRDVIKEAEALVDLDRREQLSFEHLTGNFGEAMKRVRMLPLQGAAPQWRRIVRTCAQEIGKSVSISVNVGEIEVDKHVLDALSDPIMHLLRNAVDHGIEPAAEREQLGKPASGQISIRARIAGANVELEIVDDGRGVDSAAIAARAIERKIVTVEQVERMNAADLRSLIFTQGFSTAATVSRLSGRGVGLDVVRRRIEALSGTVRMTSDTGSGARFCLAFPSSLVSTRGLLVRAGDATFALPIDYVIRAVRIPASALEHADGASVIRMQDAEPLRVRWLSSLLAQRRHADAEHLGVVIVSYADARLGLVVDEVIGEEEFVTKRLPWNLSTVNGIGGVVILGDGGLAMVVDLPHLVAQTARETNTAADAVLRAEKQRVPKILVVDDSLTSRTLERNILVAAGYEVAVAIDGEKAWQLLKQDPVDLVVADIQMPHMDGLELTRRIRGHSSLGQIPIILVTSLDGADDLSAGAAAGADEYIVKGSFDQRNLLEAVARLV